MIGKLAFLISEGLRSLWRARLPALGSILTITLTLTLFGGAYLIFGNFDRATRRLQSQYRIDVFFKPILTNGEAFQKYQLLTAVEGISSTEFISKERAASIFKREFGEDVVTVLGTNPLPAGAIVLVARGHRTARRINRIADDIATIDGVTDVAYRGELVRILERYIRIAVYGGLILGIVALLGAIFLVSNTIKLSIYAKRDTIDTLHLLGATRSFVRLPFLIEGVLQGIIGSLLAVGAILGMLDVMNYILEHFVLYRLIRPAFLALFLGTMGLLLGLIGSSRGVGRFINS
ncbi:MAG: permease-like cell division protein FtsX [Candidatus Marinimicrobia bacterium]|nr:permease-like cell division protein FtsX [Candidatus Neomarinimicrobiota bacterium]